MTTDTGTPEAPEGAASDQGTATPEASVPSTQDETSATRDETSETQVKQRRTRTPRTFPASSFMEALPLAEAIQQFGAGQKIRRLTLFEHMNRAADSGASRQLVTNSAQYGLTKGSYSAEYLELTEEGKLASGDESLGRTRLAARLELAIAKIEPFNTLYEQYQNNRIPAPAVLRDFIIERGVSADRADECVETFMVNARDLGLLRTYAGAERLLPFEMLLDEVEAGLPSDDYEAEEDATTDLPARPLMVVGGGRASSPAAVIAQAADLSDVCFLVSPIGEADTPQRKHANLVLGSVVEPALEGLGLRLVRADKISKPGVITAQVIDHLVRAPLVIADLSFGNPNVFYELALRHACRLPVVQIIRSSDQPPFDVREYRTVVMDMTDIYTLVPQIDSYRSEIARQCRSALDAEGPAESPLSLFYPSFWDNLNLSKE